MDLIEPQFSVKLPLSRSSSYYSLPEYVIDDDLDYTNQGCNIESCKHVIPKIKDFVHDKKCGERHVLYGACSSRDLPESSIIHHSSSLECFSDIYQV